MMSTRPVVSYDDITLPYDQPAPAQKQASASTAFAHPPPAKKRKKGNNYNQKKQHWDEPRRANNDAQNSQRAEFLRHANGSSSNARANAQVQLQAQSRAPGADAMVITEEDVWDEGEGEYEYEEEEEEESRELTHEEIWDDSALVDAWDSAMEEFRQYHGPDTDWKTQPVKKSPLWYNVPVDPSKKPAQATAAAPAVAPNIETATNAKVEEDEEADSRPINFDTFVPMHDASLPVPAAAEVDYTALSLTAGVVVTQDEAFERALSATYWAGYWTAMYHARQGQVPSSENRATDVAQGDEEEDVLDHDDDEEAGDAGFVSTQR